MNVKLLFTGIFACMLSVCTEAQSQLNIPMKWDGRVQKCIRQKDKFTSVIIKCKESNAVAAQINAAGYRAMVITDDIITARVPASYIPSIASDVRVEFIQASQQARATMDVARQTTGADKVQNGDGLDTPYTGKGVIIGVIDQGFEFRHIAFLDSSNNSRVIALWNRKGYSTNTDADPTSVIPATGDGFDSYGHATHVTNIAAGSKISENGYYGIAPEADIIMVPSEFNNAEVIEDVKYIRDMAKEKGEPWVVNMSFGTQQGSHDGKNYFCQAMDEILADGTGHQIVAAAGNDGEYTQHATYTFKNAKDTVRILVSSGSSGALLDLWGQNADSLKHLSVTPYFYDAQGKHYKDSAFWANYVNTYEIAPYNKEENYLIGASEAALNGAQLGIEITGDKGTTFHAWTNEGFGNIIDGPDKTYLHGDNNYCVEALGASVNNAVTAAAYVSKDSYTNYTGTTIPCSAGAVGDIATFSSTGPSLSGVPKPTVAAPGSMIVSAVSKYSSSFSQTGTTTVQDVKRGIRHYYYCAMEGTSMATPVITGIIALWLQANPNLSYSQILDIIKSTSTKDDFTGPEPWNAKWGYGKINAYEGLKAALKLADADGITSEINTAAPLTISKEGGTWHFLFNNDESFASISLCDMSGMTISRHLYGRLHRGQEETVTFRQAKHGVYIIKIKTSSFGATKKITL